MVVKVRLDGLNIVNGRGRWYVYRRSTGEALIKGFEGTRDELDAKISEPEFLQIYNRPRLKRRPTADFAAGTLGSLVLWYTNGDIDCMAESLDEPGAVEGGYPKWQKLSKATRKDYLAAYDYLRPEFDIELADISQPDLYDLRDACAVKKWPRFADKMIAALSSMFKQGVKRRKLNANPCLGMDKAHEADPNANREWFPAEFPTAIAKAPMEIKIALMAARYVGLRGQTIVTLNRKQFADHPLTGKAVRYLARKNRKEVFLPVMPEFQEFMAELTVVRSDGLIAVRDNGQPWADEVEMQTRVSHFLRDLERAGEIGDNTTLHGLRSSYAAWWKRMGATDREIADLLGDKSVRMGAHYSRHVETEANVTRAFERLKDKA